MTASHSFVLRFPVDIGPSDPHQSCRHGRGHHRAASPTQAARQAAADVQAAAEARSGRPDPYVLVLLADQEVRADRLFQAHCLIEAAYAAYDLC